MIDFTVHTTIDRPAEDVFAVVTDPARLPEWQVNTVSATVQGGGPMAAGKRLDEVHRGPGGRQIRSVVEIAAFEAPRKVSLRIVEGPLPIHGDITLEPRDGATEMAFHVHGKALRFLQPMFRRQFRKDCARLKARLEAPPAPAG